MILFSLSNPVTWNLAPLLSKNSLSFQCCLSILKILSISIYFASFGNSISSIGLQCAKRLAAFKSVVVEQNDLSSKISPIFCNFVISSSDNISCNAL